MSKNDRTPQKLRKTYIAVKRGLSEDAKHRRRMGNRIWVFLHILDRVDWETGIVHDWKDKDEADDMQMSQATLKRQRQELDDLKYIKCEQKQHSLDITVYHWVNPRSYTGDVLNKRESSEIETLKPNSEPEEDTPLSEVQGDQNCVPSRVQEEDQNCAPSRVQGDQNCAPSKNSGGSSGFSEVDPPFNKIQRSNYGVADATRLRADALANIRGWNDVLVRLAVVFSGESGIALPNPKSASGCLPSGSLTLRAGPKSNGRKKGKNEFAEVNKLWRAPLVELFADQCSEDEAFTAQVIRDAVKEMRADDLTISDPNSILKNAKSIAGKKLSAARANGNGNGHGANGNGQHAAETKVIEGVTLTTEQHKLWMKQLIELVRAKNNTPQARRSLAEQIANGATAA